MATTSKGPSRTDVVKIVQAFSKIHGDKEARFQLSKVGGCEQLMHVPDEKLHDTYDYFAAAMNLKPWTEEDNVIKMNQPCPCAICTTERDILKLFADKDETTKRAILAKLAGDSLSTIEKGKRTKAAANFIRFMQERAEMNDKDDVPPEVEAAISEVVEALRKSGFTVGAPQVIKL